VGNELASRKKSTSGHIFLLFCGIPATFETERLTYIRSAEIRDQPWAVAMAPSNFGSFSNDLLVGNFGDGTINAFDPENGHFVGELKNANGQPIAITHLWGLAFGNGGAAGPKNTLYFTAGLTSHLAPGDNPFHGLFGSLQVAGAPRAPWTR
jgi:uncharacterized protein (TIGR03118 family)